nr:unnamed protein product [Spirometra erinaceieuropaei]
MRSRLEPRRRPQGKRPQTYYQQQQQLKGPPWRLDGSNYGTPSIRLPWLSLAVQQQDWFDDNNAVISTLLVDKSRLHRAYFDQSGLLPPSPLCVTTTA